MPLRLKQRSFVPPGGLYPYLDAETGARITAGNLNALNDKVYKHRAANGLIPLSDVTIEDNVCHRLIEAGHPQLCEDAEYDFVPLAPTVEVSLSQLIRGTLTIGENLLRGNPKVDQGEANRRAAICAECSFNVLPVGCTACNMGVVREIMARVVGNSSTPHDGRLQACMGCGCFNKVQVWFPLNVLQRYLSKEVNAGLPERCWKKR